MALMRKQILQITCLISYGSEADTISSVSSVYNFLPLYIFSMLANFSEKNLEVTKSH